MRGFAAAILLIILCFNLFGYNALIHFMQQKANVQLEAMLDEQPIEDSELFELKIPLHLPYQTNRPTYERYDGEVKRNGIIYKYVKRRITNDTLYLMCIKNIKKMEYENLKTDFYKNTNDLSSKNNSQKSPSLLFKKVLVDTDNFLFGISLMKQRLFIDKKYFPLKVVRTSAAHLLSPIQPPDAFVA